VSFIFVYVNFRRLAETEVFGDILIRGFDIFQAFPMVEDDG
jgi:hypothetical protein